ncbi:MAG: diaminopimelate epimerase [Cellvibrio sp. 79]|nr:MAG: diaminopimelate epimerase [Cellvibrio sp. 79]
MKFTKYHALGNDYIVVDPADVSSALTFDQISALCDRHYGFGSDGVLFGPLKSDAGDFALQIFNPDGGEAEKSGNGLRIFCRYLWDQQLVGGEKFTVETKGGIVSAVVHAEGKSVSVAMGKVRFTHEHDGEPEIAAKKVMVDQQSFAFYPANVSNPHCVILVDEPTPGMAKKLGPVIENDGQFKNRTNVQFLKIIDRNNIRIEIWERGAGYTLASGSSSTASAAVAFALGFCDSQIAVHMPGGVIEISLDNQFLATMKGAVCKIGEGNLSAEAVNYQ